MCCAVEAGVKQQKGAQVTRHCGAVNCIVYIRDDAETKVKDKGSIVFTGHSRRSLEGIR